MVYIGLNTIQVQASPGSLRKYLPWIRGNYCTSQLASFSLYLEALPPRIHLDRELVFSLCVFVFGVGGSHGKLNPGKCILQE